MQNDQGCFGIPKRQRQATGEVQVYGNGGNGTNATGRRYTTVLVNTGTAIRYVDDAVNGAIFYIVEPGVYGMTMQDYGSAGARNIGICYFPLGQLPIPNVAPSSQSTANLVCQGETSSTSIPTVIAGTRRFTAGTIVTPRVEGTNVDGASPMFSIVKISD